MSGEKLPDIPQLGFGFMRLPMKDNQIDLAEVCKMVDIYMENGFTYFDTAYVYHEGKSEAAIKATVVDRYPRDRFKIADKLLAWILKSESDVQRIFDEQLERTGAGYFDYYLFHSIEASCLPLFEQFGCWKWAQKMKAKGLIRHFGFSFHDEPELLDEILTKHPEVEFVQLQINYIDWDNEIVHSGKCYEVAKKHNKPIFMMEPLKGGALATFRQDLEEKMKTVTPDMSVASWAMRFCASLNGVTVILSGMSNTEQLLDNINTIKNLKPLNTKEIICLKEVVKELLNAPTIGCTGCRYCTSGCPMQIRIPEMIRAYNTVLTYGEHERPHFYYNGITADERKAKTCIKCGQCEKVCPQHLPIIGILEKVSNIFD